MLPLRVHVALCLNRLVASSSPTLRRDVEVLEDRVVAKMLAVLVLVLLIVLEPPMTAPVLSMRLVLAMPVIVPVVAYEWVLRMMPCLVDLRISANSVNNVGILSRSTAVIGMLAIRNWRSNSASSGLSCQWSW